MKTRSMTTTRLLGMVLLICLKSGWAQPPSGGQACPEPRVGLEYAGDDGGNAPDGSLIPATREVTPGHKTDFEIFGAGRRWIYVAERELNRPSSNWVWKRFGPYDFVGGTRYYSHIGWSNYTVGRDFDPRWAKLSGNEAALTFEVDPTRPKPVVFRIGILLGPASNPTGISKTTRFRAGAIVNGQKLGAAAVPWVFHPNGTFEAPGIWQGTWSRQSDGSLRAIMTCNGVTDDMVIQMSAGGFVAYKNGQPYRWGTLLEEAPPPESGLGDMNVWDASENGWTGVWTRRGQSNQFDAVWHKGGATVKALLTLTVQGNSVKIQRRASSDGVSDREYEGTISPDGSVSGEVYLPGGGHYPWQGRIRH